MSRNSLHDFFDTPLDGEEDGSVDGFSDETESTQEDDTDGNTSDRVNSNTDVEQTCIVTQCVYDYDSRDYNLLKDYVVVEMAGESDAPRDKSGFVPRVQTPYPRLNKTSQRANILSHAKRRIMARYGYALQNNTSEIDEDEKEFTLNEIEGRESFTHRIRSEHIYLPQVNSSHSTISRAEAAENSRDDSDEDGAGEGEMSNVETDEYEEQGEEAQLEEEETGDEYYTDDDNSEDSNIQPYEGHISVASRRTTLNCNMYSTDGEDKVLSDIIITRSFAHLHKQEMMNAGAKTIGELFASLKRKKARERTEDTEENGDDRDNSSTLLITKRKDENEKLKNKGKQYIPKSTIPFEEKQVGKTRKKSASDDSKAVLISKKSYTGKIRSSPNYSVAFTSEIHVGPEVRGDMGNATSHDAESLTPESLTRLCSTETENRSSGRNRSIGSQQDEDSRAGYVSGRKNPQAKPMAIVREAGKSRIPLPVYRKGSATSGQHVLADIYMSNVNRSK